MSAFAGVVEQSRPAGMDDEHRLGGALVDAGGPVYTCSAGRLALAQTGGHRPDGQPLCFLDGQLYASPTPEPWPRADVTSYLARLYQRDGVNVLRRLRGDFVVLFHDEHRGKTVIARDQMGGRSLVWHYSQGRFTFASEIRFLLRLLPSRPGPDDAALAHWLAQSAPPGDRTLYAGIHRLEAAHVLRLGRGAPTVERYWSPRYRRPDAGTRAEHVTRLHAVLGEAVHRRCLAGESTAVLLSGGLDSSTVAALASRHEPDRRPRGAYSATFPGLPDVDESALVDILCDRLDLASTRAVVHAGSVLSGAIEYIDHWQVPPPSPNLFFWLPLLREAAADGVVTMLDGEGGDELFGLSPYLVADRLRHGRPAAAFDLVRRIPGGGPHLDRSALWPFVRQFGVKGVSPAWLHQMVRRHRGAEAYTPPWLLPQYQQAFLDTDWWVDWKRLSGPRWWAYVVWAATRTGPSLAYDHIRRRGTLAGIEARHPLVDVDVVECVLTIPPELAYDVRYSRPLLREAMAGLLPDEVRLRPTKSSFDSVFHNSLAGPDLAGARALLRPGDAELAAYVDLGQVAGRLLANPPPVGDRLWWGVEVWRLLTAECWLRRQAGRRLDAEQLGALVPPDLEIRVGSTRHEVIAPGMNCL